MSIKTLISCDGDGCSEEFESFDGNFELKEIIERGWHCEQDGDYHYCPSCLRKAIKSGEIELTPDEAGCVVIPDGYGGGYECNCGKCV